jgi:hypothetical protein
MTHHVSSVKRRLEIERYPAFSTGDTLFGIEKSFDKLNGFW